MDTSDRLKRQADALVSKALGKPLFETKGDPRVRPGHLGGSVAILGAEAVAGGFIEPGRPHVSTDRAVRAHARMMARTDADVDAQMIAREKRRRKAAKQAKGFVA